MAKSFAISQHSHSFESLVTAIVKAKMDQMMMREWQKYSWATKMYHHSAAIRVCGSSGTWHGKHHTRGAELASGDPWQEDHYRVWYVTIKVKGCCLVCKAGKHPLHDCKSFQASPHNKNVAIVKKSRLCIYCLKSGHFVRQCSCVHWCKVCQGPHTTHHSILTIAMKGNWTAQVVLTWW